MILEMMAQLWWGGYGSAGGYGGGGRGTGSEPCSLPHKLIPWMCMALLLHPRGSEFLAVVCTAQVAPVESGPFLGREAEDAFKAGNPLLALALMFGHMSVEERDALVALQTVKYNALLRRPVWNIRWGVSLSVRGDITGDPQPIKEGASSQRRRSGAGGANFAGPGAGRGGGLNAGGFDSGDGFPGGGQLGGLIEDEELRAWRTAWRWAMRWAWKAWHRGTDEVPADNSKTLRQQHPPSQRGRCSVSKHGLCLIKILDLWLQLLATN